MITYQAILNVKIKPGMINLAGLTKRKNMRWRFLHTKFLVGYYQKVNTFFILIVGTYCWFNFYYLQNAFNYYAPRYTAVSLQKINIQYIKISVRLLIVIKCIDIYYYLLVRQHAAFHLEDDFEEQTAGSVNLIWPDWRVIKSWRNSCRKKDFKIIHPPKL